MSNVAVLLVGLGLFELVSKLVSPDIPGAAPTAQKEWLPKRLQSIDVPPEVAEAFRWCKRDHLSFTQTISSLSQWRFLCPRSFDVMLLHIRALTEKYSIGKRRKEDLPAALLRRHRARLLGGVSARHRVRRCSESSESCGVLQVFGENS